MRRMRLPHPRRLAALYPHVVASLALFIALGGPSYASSLLPRNSVGPAQLRSSSVGSSEIKNGAVHLADIASTTRNSLRGATGPQGPAGPAGAPGANAVSYFVAVSGAGEILRGNAGGKHATNGSGSYTLTFPRNVSACVPTVTLGGIDTTNQPPGFATTRDDGGSVGVQIYDTAGSPADRSFNLVVVC
ncbi:MAG: hypothetical protein ABW167_05965 [Baekduia sp.]